MAGACPLRKLCPATRTYNEGLGGEGAMPIADAMTDWVMPAFLGLAFIAFYVGLGWGILKLYRWYRRRAETSLERAYAGLKSHWPAGEGDVTLLFHTYYGFFVWFTQIEHRVALPADQARELLKRLNLCPFVIGVPLLSLVHYWEQMRSIRRQEAQQLA